MKILFICFYFACFVAEWKLKLSVTYFYFNSIDCGLLTLGNRWTDVFFPLVLFFVLLGVDFEYISVSREQEQRQQNPKPHANLSRFVFYFINFYVRRSRLKLSFEKISFSSSSSQPPVTFIGSLQIFLVSFKRLSERYPVFVCVWILCDRITHFLEDTFHNKDRGTSGRVSVSTPIERNSR